jgi:hypothetical protein
VAGPPRPDGPVVLLYLMVGAEGVRLACEKGVMVWSGLWQAIPHRWIATEVRRRADVGARSRPARWLDGYCAYYALTDEERATTLLASAKQRAALDPDLRARLAHVERLRIVSSAHGLRAGRVRDVARGEVFIHGRWTSDPWLLMGLALRRGPWLFDERYLQQPVRYRTDGNRAMTLAVLRHARFSPPFALFQLGHEIKAARYDLFFRALRRCGVDVEGRARVDGSFAFDPLLHWIAEWATSRIEEMRWSVHPGGRAGRPSGGRKVAKLTGPGVLRR